jgi:hypothetical protein
MSEVCRLRVLSRAYQKVSAAPFEGSDGPNVVGDRLHRKAGEIPVGSVMSTAGYWVRSRSHRRDVS